MILTFEEKTCQFPQLYFFHILAHSGQTEEKWAYTYLRKLFIDIIIRVNMLLIPFLVLFHSWVLELTFWQTDQSQLASKSCAAINSLHNGHVNHNVQVDLHTQLNYVLIRNRYLLSIYLRIGRYLYSHFSKWMQVDCWFIALLMYQNITIYFESELPTTYLKSTRLLS